MLKSKYAAPIGIVSLLAFFGGLYALRQSGENVTPWEWGLCGLVALVGLLVITRGVRRAQRINAGIPVEDEFSKAIAHHAAFVTLYGSFFLWTVLALLQDHFVTVDLLIGVGMGSTFLLYGVVYWWIRLTFGRDA